MTGRTGQAERNRAPGATFTHDGLAFVWPNAQPSTQHNVMAGGQTIAISGSGHTLGLIGAGDYGSPTGTATVTYTGGTTQSSTATGGDIVAIPLQPGKRCDT